MALAHAMDVSGDKGRELNAMEKKRPGKEFIRVVLIEQSIFNQYVVLFFLAPNC